MTALTPYIGMLTTTAFLIFVAIIGRSYFGFEARVFENYSFTEAAFERNNPAVTIRLCGLMVAFIIAAYGIYMPTGASAISDLSNGAFALVAALAAIALSRRVNDYLIMSGVDNSHAVVQEQNIGVAIIEVSTYIGTAIIFGAGMSDPTHGFWFNAVWFVIGQALLVIIALVYRRLWPAVFEKAQSGSPACALSLAGILLAGSIAIGTGIRGPFTSWLHDLTMVAGTLAVWVVLMLVTWLASNVIVAGRSRFLNEIATDGNWAVGLLQGLVYITITAAFFSING